MRQTAVLFSFLVTGTLVFTTTALAADPQLLNLVMPDAKVLAGVNATNARISPFGQFILSKITLIGDPQKFIDATGFNPLQDVSEVLAASAADPSNPGGLLLARGNFPVDKFVALLAGRSNQQVQTYGGATLISIVNPKEKVAHGVAFLGTSIAMAGDLTSVKAAVDRSTQANSIDPALAVKVNDISGNQDEWVVSSASVGSLIPAKASTNAQDGPAAQVLPLLKSIQSFNGGVKFGDNVAFTGEAVTTDSKNAAALQAVIKLGLALVASNSTTAANNPQAAAAVQLLQGLQVSTNGGAVGLSLSIPEAQIETLINTAPAHAKAVAANRRSREFHNGN